MGLFLQTASSNPWSPNCGLDLQIDPSDKATKTKRVMKRKFPDKYAPYDTRIR